MLWAWVTARPYEPCPDEPSPDDCLDTRRFAVVQIDGLAHEYLMRAMAAGYTPNIQRLGGGAQSERHGQRGKRHDTDRKDQTDLQNANAGRG